MSEYIEPKEKPRKLPNLPDDFSKSQEFCQLIDKLDRFRSNIASSEFFAESKRIIQFPKTVEDTESDNSKGITTIRCLALGSPTESRNALYQLAYLMELAAYLLIDQVSIYDPVFNEKDVYLFEKHLSYVVEAEKPTNFKDTETLYFLPHAPLELTDILIKEEKPLFLLSNDVVSHTDRYTKQKLFETFPVISYLVSLSQSPKYPGSNDKVEDEEEFVVVQPKKNNRKNKNLFHEPVIDYSKLDCYFDQAQVMKFTSNFRKNDDWGNSFSDLAFHVLHQKSLKSLHPDIHN
ncbi:SRR1-domain-containing protein [Scheffersomyces xylosifermentans]|uniref:SRR1-domain-containing protein n=1 Tax=Scheffersomyces xylosifermentans TaxID=1304137 RepID=UPI00315DCEA9